MQKDLISRQEAIDALDCISGVEEVLRSLPSAQPEHVADINKKVERAAEIAQNVQNEDLIQRKAAIDLVESFYKINESVLNVMVFKLKQLPPAQPERKHGKWEPFDFPWFRCSECGAERENVTFMENFCPNCGADMRGTEDG